MIVSTLSDNRPNQNETVKIMFRIQEWPVFHRDNLVYYINIRVSF